MNLPKLEEVKTADEAQGLAIDWQQHCADGGIGYSELSEYQKYFEVLANKFDLTDEFQENGII